MELDYGKVNGWPALKLKTVQACSKHVGGDPERIEGSVFSETGPSESPVTKEPE